MGTRPQSRKTISPTTINRLSSIFVKSTDIKLRARKQEVLDSVMSALVKADDRNARVVQNLNVVRFYPRPENAVAEEYRPRQASELVKILVAPCKLKQ